MKDVAEHKLAFKAKLDQLIAIAKDKKGILEQEDINEVFSDMDLEPSKIEQIYEYLEAQNIDILGNLNDADMAENDRDLSNLP